MILYLYNLIFDMNELLVFNRLFEWVESAGSDYVVKMTACVKHMMTAPHHSTLFRCFITEI